MRPWAILAWALLLTGCAHLHQPLGSSHTPLVADQRFHDLQALVTGEQSGEQSVQARFNQELSLYQTDSRYACRHPVYAHYFSRRLKQTTDISQCPDTVPFYVYDRRHGGEVRYIRPDQVAAIHLLFFSNGENLVSRFGHVGLRLLICPAATPADSTPTVQRKACDQNLFEHVTLGYMAQINSLEVSFFKGLTGGYRARLMAFPFMDTYFVNTVLENRNIYSLPLTLDSESISEVVRELSEIQWTYNGRYRFLTNNCATLLQDTLNGMWHDHDADKSLLPDSDYRRPDHLFAAIKASPLAKSASLNSLEQAEAAGFYFPSNQPYYQKALDMLNQYANPISYASLQEYAAAPAQTRMQPWLNDAQFTTALTANARLLEALTLVEEYVLLLTNQQITQETFKLLAKEEIGPQLEQLVDKITDPVERDFLQACYVRPLQEMTRQTRLSDGIPDTTFIDQHYVNDIDCVQSAVKIRVNAKIKAQLAIDNSDSKYLDHLGNQLSVTDNNLKLLERLK